MTTPPISKRRGWKLVLGGMTLGVVLLAGTSYVVGVTDQRPFCATCHIMQPQAITHKLSTHTNVSCNDCHLPQGSFVNHYAYKAYTGVNDIYVNTFSAPELPITTTQGMKDIIDANCRRCHAATNMNVASMNAKPYCTDCHRNVPHMRTKPVSTRMVAYE